LILELDNQPAMPYLLSLIPKPRSNVEKLHPRPLVAELHGLTPNHSRILLNVEGGANSRGAIALDPHVAPGRLANGIKVSFGRLGYNPNWSVALQQSGLHLQLEIPQKDIKGEFHYPSKLNETQVVQEDFFSAVSEEGFLWGRKNSVPWFCRVPGTKMHQTITKIGRRGWIPFIYRKQPDFVNPNDVYTREEFSLKVRGSRAINQMKREHSQKATPRHGIHKTSRELTPQKLSLGSPSHHGQIRLESFQAGVKKRLKSLPATRSLILRNKLRYIPYIGKWAKHGDRRYSFRSRNSWESIRNHGFVRSGMRPGGFKTLGTILRRQKYAHGSREFEAVDVRRVLQERKDREFTGPESESVAPRDVTRTTKG